MEFRRIRRERWQWDLVPELWPVEPELFAQLQDPKKDFRSRLVSRQDRESWYESKLDHPKLPALIWIRVRDYSELNPLNFFWRKTNFRSAFLRMGELGPKKSFVPRPYACGRMRRDLRVQREVLAFAPLTHFQPLPQWLKDNFDYRLTRNSFEDKKDLTRRLMSAFREMFSSQVALGPDSILEDFLCRMDEELRIVFRFPEKIRIRERTPEAQRHFLAWLLLELRPYLPKTYLIRLLNSFLQAEGLGKKSLHSEFQEIFSRAEQILDRRIEKMQKQFWRKKSSFFWFDLKAGRVLLHYSIDQNQALGLIPQLALLSRRREKIRITPIGEKEPLECEVMEATAKPGNERPVTRAFWFYQRLLLENVPGQRPLLGVESSRGDFLIYQPLSSSSVGLNEYLARVLADELSGKSWDRKILLRLAHLLLALHERGMVYQQPQGDEIWVEELPEARMNFYLTHLERLAAAGRLEAESAGRNLFEIFSSLPLSEPDSLIILEEYLRHTAKFKDFKKSFSAHSHLTGRAGSGS